MESRSMKLQFRQTAGAIAVLLLAATSFPTVHAQATPPDDLQTPPLLPSPAPPMGGPDVATAPLSDSFDQLDRDRDGAVTPNEAQRNQQVAMSFQRLDESRDGRLDLAEYAQLRTPLPR